MNLINYLITCILNTFIVKFIFISLEFKLIFSNLESIFHEEEEYKLCKNNMYFKQYINTNKIYDNVCDCIDSSDDKTCLDYTKYYIKNFITSSYNLINTYKYFYKENSNIKLVRNDPNISKYMQFKGKTKLYLLIRMTKLFYKLLKIHNNIFHLRKFKLLKNYVENNINKFSFTKINFYKFNKNLFNIFFLSKIFKKSNVGNYANTRINSKLIKIYLINKNNVLNSIIKLEKKANSIYNEIENFSQINLIYNLTNNNKHKINNIFIYIMMFYINLKFHAKNENYNFIVKKLKKYANQYKLSDACINDLYYINNKDNIYNLEFKIECNLCGYIVYCIDKFKNYFINSHIYNYEIKFKLYDLIELQYFNPNIVHRNFKQNNIFKEIIKNQYNNNYDNNILVIELNSQNNCILFEQSYKAYIYVKCNLKEFFKLKFMSKNRCNFYFEYASPLICNYMFLLNLKEKIKILINNI